MAATITGTAEYRAWQTARHRCGNPSSPAWADYGGRGITMCDEWQASAHAFVDHIGPKPSPKHELDRIDNNQGYEPGNVRWVTRSENARNRRSTTWVSYRGEDVRLIDLCERFGIRQDTARCRLRAGWSVEDSVETPVRQKAPNGSIAEARATRGRGLTSPTEASTVREIRRLKADGLSQRAIREALGVSRNTVGRILRGERHADVV